MDAGAGAFGRPGVRGAPVAEGVGGADRDDGDVPPCAGGQGGVEHGPGRLHGGGGGARRGAHEDLVQRKVLAAAAPKTRAKATSPAQPTQTSERLPRPAIAWDTASLR